MSDDSSKLIDKTVQKACDTIAEAASTYAEIYPSIIPRLQAVANSADPEIRKRMAALGKAAAARETRRRETLIQLYSLTQTEARIAIHLADGGSLSGYAEVFEVAVGTARSQLKSVFAKTGVNRQSALAALVPRP